MWDDSANNRADLPALHAALRPGDTAMTHLFDEPSDFAASALRGYCDVHARLVRPTEGGVLRATATPDGKVAVVVGGGSGHYPAFAGYVGAGFADAAVAGDVFASPSTRYIRSVCARAHRGGGVLLGYGNYAGDVLNFGLAAEQLRADGIDVRILAVTDDVASAEKDAQAKRRGVAGDLAVFKLAGAAAEAGQDLDSVEHVARLANARTRSFGVAFGGCTLPGGDGPLFTVPEGRMAIGLGIHGEPGVDETAIPSAAALATLLVDRLLGEAPDQPGTRVAAILNGLGSTKHEELFVLWSHVGDRLREAGLELVAPQVGEFVTSLDMEGCSLTLTWLDDTLEPLWLAPCDTAALRIGDSGASVAAPIEEETPRAAVRWPDATPDSQAAGRLIADRVGSLAKALAEAEPELGRIDAQAGDGDHGQGMTRGSAAAAAAAEAAARQGAGAASVLGAAADAWADRAGGTSGAIWGLGLRSASQCLDDDTAIAAAQVARGAERALEAVMRLGGAKPGDKTLVDALEPFVRVLAGRIDDGAPVAEAWRDAAAAADKAAHETARMLPKLGRAARIVERSRGHRDAGAVSLALCAKTVLGGA